MSKRPAAILIAVLVCLGIASAITATTVQSSLRQRREIRRHWQMEQTHWLIESAVIRLRQQMADDKDYEGESWDVSAALKPTVQGEVLIQPDKSKSQWRLTAVIRDAVDESLVTRRSRMISIAE